MRRGGRWAVVAVVLGLMFGIFRLGKASQTSDSHYSLLVAQELVEKGRFDLSEHFREPLAEGRYPGVAGRGLPYQVARVRARVYYVYPWGGAVLSVPGVWVAQGLGWSAHDREGVYQAQSEVSLERTLAALLMMAFVGVLAWTGARLGLRGEVALGAACVVGVASPVLSSGAMALWSHDWGALLSGVALLMLAKERISGKECVILGTILPWMYFCRPTLAIAGVGVMVYLFIRQPRLAWVAGLTAALWLGANVMLNWSLFERATSPLYASMSGNLSVRSIPAALPGLLVSPSRGLLVFCPWIAVVGVGMWRWRGRLEARGLVGLCVGICIVHLGVMSCWPVWWILVDGVFVWAAGVFGRDAGSGGAGDVAVERTREGRGDTGFE